jgi:hypothetical protein
MEYVIILASPSLVWAGVRGHHSGSLTPSPLEWARVGAWSLGSLTPHPSICAFVLSICGSGLVPFVHDGVGSLSLPGALCTL